MKKTTIFEFKSIQGQSEELLSFFKKILPGTRSFLGNEGAEISRLSEHEFIIITRWQLEQNLGEYLNWREERGDFSLLLSLLEQAPNIVSYDLLEGI